MKANTREAGADGKWYIFRCRPPGRWGTHVSKPIPTSQWRQRLLKGGGGTRRVRRWAEGLWVSRQCPCWSLCGCLMSASWRRSLPAKFLQLDNLRHLKSWSWPFLVQAGTPVGTCSTTCSELTKKRPGCESVLSAP